jgi:ferritin-like metal-binding protein YciE
VSITNPQEKFTHELCLTYDAEHQFLEAQQQMLGQVSDGELQGMIQTHIDDTQQQIQNLEQVFSQMSQEPQRQSSQAAQGLVADGQTSLQEAEGGPVADTLIAGAQAKVEHFEIASYQGLVTGAQQMGQDEVVNLLQENLQQEQNTAQMIEQSAPQLMQKAMQTG